MKRTRLFLTMGLALVSSLAWAAAPPCVPGTLASYIALGSGGCSIGMATFAEFGYAAKASGGARPIPPDQIKVNPTFVPFSAELSFSASWKAANGQTQDSFIKYTVVLVTENGSFGTLTLQLGTSQVGTFGTAAVRETTDVGDVGVLTECVEVCTSQKTESLQFWPLATLQVLDRVSLLSRSGGAVLSSFKATFDLCPLCT